MSTILAIDLGKYNSIFCWYQSATHEAVYRSAATTPESLRSELQRQPVSTVVIEACSQAGWVSDLCQALSLPCDIANTNDQAWQWKHVKRKTDKDDALKLARLRAVGELNTVTLPSPALRQWKSLISLRKRLIGEQGRIQNRVRGVILSQGLPAPVGNRAWTQAGLKQLQLLAKPLEACSPLELWRGEVDVLLTRYGHCQEHLGLIERKLDALCEQSASVQLLISIPGVGMRTAEVISSHLGEGSRFQSAEEVSAYAGLVPRQYQSGQTDRRGAITKRGSKVLRSALVECAWCSLRYNSWALATWQRLISQGVSRKKAVVALARSYWCGAGRCCGKEKSGRNR